MTGWWQCEEGWSMRVKLVSLLCGLVLMGGGGVACAPLSARNDVVDHLEDGRTRALNREEMAYLLMCAVQYSHELTAWHRLGVEGY